MTERVSDHALWRWQMGDGLNPDGLDCALDLIDARAELSSLRAERDALATWQASARFWIADVARRYREAGQPCPDINCGNDVRFPRHSPTCSVPRLLSTPPTTEDAQ